MPDEHYIHPRLAAVYDITCGWSEDRQFFADLATTEVKTVLDLGCGTGILARAYANLGCKVTGVDPAFAMLDVARQSMSDSPVDYVCADATTFRSGQHFDLIVMTGHAFQVFLEDADVQAVLRTMQTHLAHQGRIVFETRNPAIDWESRWNTNQSFMNGDENYSEIRRVKSRDPRYIEFETQYVFADETIPSFSKLRFHTVEELLPMISRTGLQVRNLFGDWNGSAYDPAVSEEMIFVLEKQH